MANVADGMYLGADKEYAILKFLDGQWVMYSGTATVA